MKKLRLCYGFGFFCLFDCVTTGEMYNEVVVASNQIDILFV